MSLVLGSFLWNPAILALDLLNLLLCHVILVMSRISFMLALIDFEADVFGILLIMDSLRGSHWLLSQSKLTRLPSCVEVHLSQRRSASLTVWTVVSSLRNFFVSLNSFPF